MEHGTHQQMLRVLVCDDELGMRLGIARALRDFRVAAPDLDREFGFEILQAESGEQAIEMVETAGPDKAPHILLLDHKLPAMSGLDVLERLAPRMGDMLTIMITAYASIETAVRATKQGAYDFLAKPFTPAELKDSVRKAAKHVIVAAEAHRLAREKRQIRFQFISVLAHELKSPIGAIEGYMKVLQTPGIVQSEATYAQIIDRCLTRTLYMRKMINDLLDLTHIESGQKRRALVTLDIVEAARTALESVRADADARGITLELHAESPVIMDADPNEMEIILNNLVSNAVKYNRDDGRVDVTVESWGDKISVEVRDTGIGMEQEECARLFQDFVRIKNEKTQGILGSGLGLSIVKKVAQLYNGDVSVTSQPNVGTVFTAVLRRTAPGRETALASQDAPAANDAT